jgi:hypothetical protein
VSTEEISPFEAGWAAFSVEMTKMSIVISTERSEWRNYCGFRETKVFSMAITILRCFYLLHTL